MLMLQFLCRQNNCFLAGLAGFPPFKEKIKSLLLTVVEIEGRQITVLIGQFISGKEFFTESALNKRKADKAVEIDFLDGFVTADVFKFVLVKVAHKKFYNNI